MYKVAGAEETMLQESYENEYFQKLIYLRKAEECKTHKNLDMSNSKD